jgi:hypothetical protein
MMMNSDEKLNVVQGIEIENSYKTALDTRNFEISLFWQRSNYFLVLNSALALGFFNLQRQEYALFLALFGFIVSLLWFRVNLGSKFWQSRWEQRLSEIEKKIDPELHFFSADWVIIKSDVENIIKDSSEHKKHGPFRRWVNKQVLTKPSVSIHMIWLSVFFMVG